MERIANPYGMTMYKVKRVDQKINNVANAMTSMTSMTAAATAGGWCLC